jgi:hypothetical protein
MAETPDAESLARDLLASAGLWELEAQNARTGWVRDNHLARAARLRRLATTDSLAGASVPAVDK